MGSYWMFYVRQCRNGWEMLASEFSEMQENRMTAEDQGKGHVTGLGKLSHVGEEVVRTY